MNRREKIKQLHNVLKRVEDIDEKELINNTCQMFDCSIRTAQEYIRIARSMSKNDS